MSQPIFLFSLFLLKAIVLAEDQFLDYGDCNGDQVVQVQQQPLPIQLPFQQVIQPRPVGLQLPSPIPVQQQAPVGLVPNLPLVPFQPQTLYGRKNVVYYIVPVPYPLKEKPNEEHTKPKPSESQEEKSDECPAETKRDCFKATPYQGCENDYDCEGTQKCCFDACLEQLVCKPSTKQ